jgi:hypothetical protein
MNKLFAAAAVATVIASPMAQSYDPSVGSGNLNSAPYHHDQASPYQGGTAGWDNPYGAYARSPDIGNENASPSAVYDAQGNAIGADPDPSIRGQLRRESEMGRW